jgi:glycosyltransferase involved in cell wall biosynthesis
MNIAILSFYSGHKTRGAENWTHEIAKRLSSRGHRVFVYQNFNQMNNSKYKSVSAKLETNWHRPSAKGKLSRRFFTDYWSILIARFTIKIIPSLWKENFDVIIPTNGGWQPAFIRIFTWLKRSKMVVVGHSGIGWDDRNNLWCFPNCFVALSQGAASWAKKANPLINVEMIPNGVDTKVFRPKGDKLNIKLKPPVILCVAALETGKRIDLAIDAVANMSQKASLLVAGEGEDREKLLKMGKHKLKERFSLMNFQYKDMPKVYRSVDLFTSPSESVYAFEMVILEAMATNLPVVVNDDAIRKGIVGNVGVLVDPVNRNAYINALTKALNTDWGDRPRKRSEKYSWDVIVGDYEKLFKGLIKG